MSQEVTGAKSSDEKQTKRMTTRRLGMRTCNACHFQNEDNSRYCRGCGVVLQSSAPTPVSAPAPSITCPRCQKVSPPGTRFCGNCALPLTHNANAPQYSTPVPKDTTQELQNGFRKAKVYGCLVVGIVGIISVIFLILVLIFIFSLFMTSASSWSDYTPS